VIVDVEPAHKIKDLTGPGHTDAYGVGGTDLGATVVAPNGRLVSVFGDTFEKATVGGRGWRAPVVLFGYPESVPTGLRWYGSAGPGVYAHQVVDYRHRRKWDGCHVVTVLPTDLLRVGDTLYLHVMVCRELGHVWWTELHASTDNGSSWRPTGTRWPGGHHDGLFQMLTWERGDDGWVYALTTGFQRQHGLILHRVRENRVTDPSAWQSWGFDADGWAWGKPPTVALPGRFGELSLRRVQGRWMLCVFDDGGYRMDVLALDSPTADLHRAPRATVLRGCNWPDEDHAHGRVAQLYGGYILPGSTWSRLFLMVSQWNSATNWPYHSMQFEADVSALMPAARI
jgi:hypothetical protein